MTMYPGEIQHYNGEHGWQVYVRVEVEEEFAWERALHLCAILSSFAGREAHFRLVGDEGRVLVQYHGGRRIPLPSAEEASLPRHEVAAASAPERAPYERGNDD